VKKLILAAGVLVLIAFGVVIYAPGLMIARSPITLTPQDVDLSYEETTLQTNDGVDIAAWWIPTDEPKAAVIFVHGGQSNRSAKFSGHLSLMRDLHQLDYATMAIDLRNHGASGESPNGPMPKLGLEEWQDVAAASAYITRRHRNLPVFAFGSSMGGATVLHAAYNDGSIRAVAVQDPVLLHRPVIRNFMHASNPGMPEPVISTFLWSMETFYSVPLTTPLTLDIAIKAAQRTPILVIQNDADPIVDKSGAIELAERAPKSELWLTSAPPKDHPVLQSSGPWGSHVRSYTLYKEEFVERLDRFYTKAITSASREFQE